MRLYRIHIKGYTKGVRENNYMFNASNESVAVSRALKQFRKDYPRIQYDEIIIKVR